MSVTAPSTESAAGTPSVALPRAIVLIAVAAAAAVLPTVWQFADTAGIDRDGGLAMLAVALATLALASSHAALRWGGLGLLLLATLQLLLPLLGAVDRGDAAIRAPFSALSLLAATGVLLHLIGGSVARRAAAVIAGVALTTIMVRLFGAAGVEDELSPLWPEIQLFVAPAALASALAWPLIEQLRRTLEPARLAIELLAMWLLGIVAMALIGHAIGSELLTRGVGANPLAPQTAMIVVLSILLIRAALDRSPRYHLLLAALLAFMVLNAVEALWPSSLPLPIAGIVPEEGQEPGRALITAIYLALLVLSCMAIASPSANRWALRFAWLGGLSAMLGSAVALTGVLAGVLFGIEPILGAWSLSFLGLLALMALGAALFCAATVRASTQQFRMEALPAAVMTAVLAIGISLWGAVSRQSIDAIDATGDVALDAMTRTLAAEWESRERDFSRLAAQLSHDEPPARSARVQAAGKAMSARYRTLARLTWLGDDGSVLSYAASGTVFEPLAAVRTVAQFSPLEARLRAASGGGRAAAFGAAAANGGRPRSLGMTGWSDGLASGTLIALFHVTDADLPAVVGKPVPGFGAHVVIDGVDFGVQGSAAVPIGDAPLVAYLRTANLAMLGVPLHLTVWPRAETVERLRSRLPPAILGGGLLIAALLAAISILGAGARERAVEAQRARAHAEQSQREIAELLEGLPDAFFAIDRNWVFTYLNRASERMVRQSRERVIGRTVWETSDNAERDLGAHYRRAMELRCIEHFEIYDEKLGIWMSLQAFPLPAGIGVVARDVSAERATIESLRRREADLAEALDIADLARFEMDANEQLRWSGPAARVLGRAESELPADRAELRALWHPEDAATLLPVTAEKVRTGQGFDIQHRITWPDGSIHWVHTVARPLIDGDGTQRMVATVQDITVQKLQERAVLERDRFFEASRELFCILDGSGRFVEANPALCRLFGVEREKLLGRFAFDFTHPADRERAFAGFNKARDKQPREARATRSITRSGEVRWVAWSSSPSVDGDLYVAGHDMTEYMVAETAREQALRELQSRNEELQQFAYIASHDLQEPLRKIEAFGDRLRSRFAALLGEDGRDYLLRMDHAAQRMSTLISDLLDYSRVSSTAEPFVPVALADVLADVLGDLEESLRVSAGSIDSGPLPVIDADRMQMAQLLQNLIGNALKYRHADRVPVVAVRAEVFASAQPGSGESGEPWIRLRVIDNGIGFEPAYSERIFAPFQRLHGRAEYAGTGIGLAIVRKIVERHGGRVRAEGEPGLGATFVVELPMRHGSTQEAAA